MNAILTEEQIERIIDAQIEMHIHVPLQWAFWTRGEVESYLKCPRAEDMETLHVDFPDRYVLPGMGDDGKDHLLWKAIEVIAWAEQYQC